jgi:hypothetical protein
MSNYESFFGTGKRKVIIFLSIFLGSIMILSASMYFVPKGRQMLFGPDSLRPAAGEDIFSGEVGGYVFADVEGSNPHAYALAYLKSRGVVRGYADNTFRPDDLIKRSEVVKLVVGAKHIYPHSVVYSYCFNDVANEWFAPYVCFAKKREWVSGSGDNIFSPEKNVKGAEVLKIIMEAYNVEVNTDTEEGSDEPWYNPYVDVAKDRGWIEEDKNYRFNPEAEMTRSEVAEILFRVIVSEIAE